MIFSWSLCLLQFSCYFIVFYYYLVMFSIFRTFSVSFIQVFFLHFFFQSYCPKDYVRTCSAIVLFAGLCLNMFGSRDVRRIMFEHVRQSLCSQYHVWTCSLFLFQFLFAQDPTNSRSCHYCVHVHVRTVNILEKRESKSYKKDKYRRKCNGRRCCLGGRIASIPCQASYMASDDFEDYDEVILFFQIILVHFILFFKSSSAKQLACQE